MDLTIGMKFKSAEIVIQAGLGCYDLIAKDVDITEEEFRSIMERPFTIKEIDGDLIKVSNQIDPELSQVLGVEELAEYTKGQVVEMLALKHWIPVT